MFQFFNDFGFTCVVNERCDELRADKNMYYRKIPNSCLLYTSPSPRDVEESRMPSSA